MAKSRPIFECQACGHKSSKWMGKCPNCGGWDSFLELSETQKKVLESSALSLNENAQALPITEVKEETITRFSTSDKELDMVLGGGVVPGSLVLIGGSPGVGKSTLLLKMGGLLANNNKKVLYVSGEESAGQIKMRATRLGADHKDLYLLTEIKLELILGQLSNGNFDVVVIDSIQTLYSEQIASAPGSVSQVREITFSLMRYAKENNIAIFIIGHITKDGSIAGPRVLEHMVDTVLYFEGESNRELRILRGFKNRFGSTSEIGIFEMTHNGLESATNISSKFFSLNNSQSGSAITVMMEGSRPIIIEVQALVSESFGANPRRSATGFDANRLTMLLALLERKLDLPFNRYDVFINIVGGIKISETSADLAIIAAIISSFKNRPISHETIFIGEVSLTGDIRDVFSLENRLKEAQSHGFTKAIIPARPSSEPKGIKLFVADEVTKVIEWM